MLYGGSKALPSIGFITHKHLGNGIRLQYQEFGLKCCRDGKVL